MSLKECYVKLGGDYEEVLARLFSEDMVRRFLKKFLSDGTYRLLLEKLSSEDYPEAFRAAHTLKGVCENLGLLQADEKIMNEVLSNEDALHSRIYLYPTSAIKQNDRKINYRDFLMSAEYKSCSEAVKRIVHRIDMEVISEFIDSTPYLSDLQRAFYKHYIKARYNLILVPASDLAVSLQQEPIMGI